MTEKELAEVLLQLQAESRLAGRNNPEVAIHSLMDKYDMLFLGAQFNTIYTDELLLMLKQKLNLLVSKEDLLKMVPTVCAALHMHTEAMVNVKDMHEENPPIAQYSIELF